MDDAVQHLKMAGCEFIHPANASVGNRDTYETFKRKLDYVPVDLDHPGPVLLGMRSLQTLDINRSCASRTAIEEVCSVHLQRTRTCFCMLPPPSQVMTSSLRPTSLSVRMPLLRLTHLPVCVSEGYIVKL